MNASARIWPLAALLATALTAEGCSRRHLAPQTAPTTPPSSTSTSAQPATSAPDAPGAPQGANPTAEGPVPYAGPAAGNGMAGRPGRALANLSLPQFQVRFRKRLMQGDTDHDGRISLQEWTAWRASRPNPGRGDPARAFQHFDLNHDGFLTPDEIDAMAARRYARRNSTMASAGGEQAGQAAGAGGDQGPE